MLELPAVESPANSRNGLRRQQEISRKRVWGDSVVQYKNVLEAIRLGEFAFEPNEVGDNSFDPTGAMPGTSEKLTVLAARVEAGLPLWNHKDRTDHDQEDPLFA